MTTAITLHMTSRIGDDTIERALKGRYHLKDGQAKLMYRQTLEEGKEAVTEIITVDLDRDGSPVKAVIRRPGSGFELVLVQEQKSSMDYQTPAGAMTVTASAMAVEGAFEEERLRLALAYQLDLGGYQTQAGITIESL
ncbi:MAG TPA: hypothetical protein DEP00_02755 [Lachnospiraceae bacterium]|nr:hypothetical protein [Lachnospiraceae bacterium]